MEVVVEKFVKYFTSVFHHTRLYFAQFVVIEFVNMGLLFLNFWLTDQFLQGRFRYAPKRTKSIIPSSRTRRCFSDTTAPR